MPSNERRAAARRRAWGRGPIILRFDSLESRQLLSARNLPDLVSTHFSLSTQTAEWGDSLDVSGTILNQGRSAVPQAFDVEIIASTSATIQPSNAFVLGNFTIPGDLGAGQTVNYDQQVTLPPTALTGYVGKPIYIASYIAPGHAVKESDYRNNYSVGVGYDTGVLTIVPQQPSQLVGTSFSVSANATSWGQQVTVSAQVVNNAQGTSPATRAAVVLTPSGVTPGTGGDYTLGYLSVPSLAAWQTTNLVQTFTLPAVAPAILAASGQFTISMIQDVDYLTNPMYPHQPTQGNGLDQAQLTIGPGATTSTTAPVLPDLAAGTVTVAGQAHWGGSFPVSAVIQNLGQGVSAPFNVIFVMTGQSGTLNPAIFLGQTPVNGLAPGASQVVNTTLLLPSRLPAGTSINSVGVGRVAMLIDPENVVSETSIANNISFSNPVNLRLLGADGSTTVPTTAAPALLGNPQPQGTLTTTTTTASPKTTPSAVARSQAIEFRRLHIRATPSKPSLTDKVWHNLKVFPKAVDNLVLRLFK